MQRPSTFGITSFSDRRGPSAIEGALGYTRPLLLNLIGAQEVEGGQSLEGVRC